RETIARKGLITASAGNHAQGVAFSAKLFGVQDHVTIYMPKGTPGTKQEKTRTYGVNVKLHGENYDEARSKAEEEAKRLGSEYVPAFDDLDVIAGQGTIGLEIMNEIPTLDAVVVPVGGGGLISGIAVAVKNLALSRKRKVKIIGVEPVGAHCAYYARQQSKPATGSTPP
ncbi:pyridoxal-phosphate dependent enzyme, partial [Acidobacteria bacterium AH-259-D05]|nr:pyridoxal-phosphate dependent enzyme [Acidobacteria bacterium AH-259-D05]